jgi:ABC-2 type transport system ATP-binding protein
MSLIQAQDLIKTFGSTSAVDGVSFAVKAGEIYGLVGSDGAGKTTTLRLLIGALQADSGTATICGYDVAENPEEVRSRVGYLSQRFSLYEDLSVLENIRFFAEVRGLSAAEWKPRCLELLEFVGLSEFSSRRAGALSGGMKQKLGLASALVTRPQILLLDEPTTGVDPATRQDFWHLIIRVVQREGMAVMLTTPYMDEASRCHRLGFMRGGRIIAEGSPAALCAKLSGRILEIQTNEPLLLRSSLLAIPGVEDARPFGDWLHVRTAPGGAQEFIRAVALLPLEKPLTHPARLIPPTLEDVFLSYITEGESKP